MIKAYGLKKCSTTKKALDWLKAKKVNVDFTDYSETPPTPQHVATWIAALGGWEKMINRAGYTWRGLDKAETENLTDAKAAKLAAKHTSLIRRPLIEHADGSVTAGMTDKVKALF